MRVNRRAFLAGSAGLLTLAACGTNSDTDATVINISAILDQDQEKLNRLYDAVADRFAAARRLAPKNSWLQAGFSHLQHIRKFQRNNYFWVS